MGALACAALLSQPGCGVGYVLNSAYHQMALLASREPVEAVRARCELRPSEVAALDLIADAKRYGEEIGLAGSANYDTIAVGWDHIIWNVSGSAPLAFESKTWWFPIVGRVPYLGFFNEAEAREAAAAMEAEGLDVMVRTAGAYSTLGWFEDPILPPMLTWEPYDLVNTVLHELTHATVWVPGSVDFNESFANFIGDVAAFRYLRDRYGEDSAEVQSALTLNEDRDAWRRVLQGLTEELERVYADTTMSDDAKRTRKGELFATLHQRIDDEAFHAPQPYHRYVEGRPFNNALLLQFRTYNNQRDLFEALLERCGGDLQIMMKRVGQFSGDPYEALEAATL